MLYSIIVFIILYSITFLFSYCAVNSVQYKNNIWKSPCIYMLLLGFSLIIGLRWDVGKDYMSYYDLCVGNYRYDSQIERIEFLSKSLLMLCNEWNFPYYFWFIVMAFLQIYFVVKAMLKGYTKYLPVCMFFFLVLFLGYNMNIIRQGVAYSIVFYSISFLSERRTKMYIAYIIFASLFHKSALVLLPFGLINYNRINVNVFFQLIIYVLFIILGPHVIDFVTSKVEPILMLIWGSEKYDKMVGGELENQVSSGYGVMYIDFLCIIVILFSKRILRLHEKVRPYYWLFFCGACFYHCAMKLQYFLRIDLFFFFPIVLLMSMVVRDVQIKSLNFIVFILGFCMAVVTAISSNWSFVWDRFI